MIEPYYSEDGITIYHGDCRDVLPQLERVDLVLTDPPYEIVASGGGIGAKRQYLKDIHGHIDGGFDISVLAPFKRWFCFCGKEQLVDLINLASERGRWALLTWNKSNPTPLVNGNYLPDTEYIVHSFTNSRDLFGKYEDRSRFILHPAQANKTGHPTAKPTAVIKRLLRVGSEEGDIILDPYMGGGSTLRAAKDLGLKSIGIEIERKYCDIAIERLRQQAFSFEATT